MEKAQDARHFVESLQYWQGGNPENLENLILSTSANYVPALKGVDFAVAEPQLFPEVGIWHPLAPVYYEDLKEYLNWWVAFQKFGFCTLVPARSASIVALHRHSWCVDRLMSGTCCRDSSRHMMVVCVPPVWHLLHCCS